MRTIKCTGDLLVRKSTSVVSIIVFTLFSVPSFAVDISNNSLKTYTNGETLMASDLNSDFTVLKDAVNTKQDKLTGMCNAITEKMTGVNVDGSIVCQTDAVGTTTGSGDGHSLDSADGSVIDALFVDNVGNVGIGTTTPDAGLVVSGGSSPNSAIGIENTTSGTQWRLVSQDNGALSVEDSTGAIVPIYVNSAGKTLVGTAPTAPNSFQSMLTVNANIPNISHSSASLTVGAGSPTGWTGIYQGQEGFNTAVWSHDTNGTYLYHLSGRPLFLQPYGGGNVGVATTTAPTLKFYVNGTAGGTSAWTATSDGRYKKDVKPISSALEKVLQLQGVTYKWKKDQDPNLNFSDATQVGFIAQDVEKVMPEIVNKDKNGVYSIAYGLGIPVLVEAIKEQQQIIEDLNKKVKEVETLKSQLSELKNIKTEMAELKKMVSTIMANNAENNVTAKKVAVFQQQ